MNLKQTILDLKAAIAERRWLDAMRLAAVLLNSGADLGELVIGTANTEDVTAELDALKVECETVVYPTTVQPKAIDPATVVKLVLLVIELVRKARKK